MAGIYIHIPFCKQACHYCNFHFSTSLKNKKSLVEAIAAELSMRSEFLDHSTVNSIYLGGGTPSLLSSAELLSLFQIILKNFSISGNAEITLEANPDDLSFEKVKFYAEETPVNRLSVGIQSFYNEDLTWMNRAHNAQEARQCLEWVSSAFDNYSLDLIYGIPGLTEERWIQNLQLAVNYHVPHLSCYALTVEPRTALHHAIKTGRELPIDSDLAADQFTAMCLLLEKERYNHYEISSFCKPGMEAVHNKGYWFGAHYLGVGPSAHSFNGLQRSWNIANNSVYIKAMADHSPAQEMETLSDVDRYNEYVMVRLRTQWGCELKDMEAMGDRFLYYFHEHIKKYLDVGMVVEISGNYALTSSGKLFADQISADVFFAD